MMMEDTKLKALLPSLAHKFPVSKDRLSPQKISSQREETLGCPWFLATKWVFFSTIVKHFLQWEGFKNVSMYADGWIVLKLSTWWSQTNIAYIFFCNETISTVQHYNFFMACVRKWQAKFQWYKSQQQQPGASLAQGLHQHVVKTKADRLNLKHFDPFFGHFW